MRTVALTKESTKDILENLLKRSPNNYGKFEAAVDEILNKVKTEGDAALFAYTKEFDKTEICADTIKVTEEEIKEVNFFNILENDSVLVDDEVEIEALFDLFRKMCIDEQLSDVNKTEAKEIPLGSQGFIMTVFTKSGDVMVYQYDQLGRNAYSGYGFFSDSSNKYSVHNLDLTRIWLRLFEGK